MRPRFTAGYRRSTRRAAELPGDGFRAAAGELNAFLSPVGDREAAGALGNLDEGCDALLFCGLTVTERVDVEDSMAILPFGEVWRFVERELRFPRHWCMNRCKRAR